MGLKDRLVPKAKPAQGDYVWGKGKMRNYSIRQDGTVVFHGSATPKDLAEVQKGEYRDRPSH